MPDRVALAGLLYRLCTGCQWKALPREFGSGSTCHLRMQQWRRGVFRPGLSELVRYYHKKRGLHLRWSSLDSAIVKAPLVVSVAVRPW